MVLERHVKGMQKRKERDDIRTKVWETFKMNHVHISDATACASAHHYSSTTVTYQVSLTLILHPNRPYGLGVAH